eukprot:m51a1_g1737 hypothetical protein (231) ;mRNA; f:167735-168427
MQVSVAIVAERDAARAESTVLRAECEQLSKSLADARRTAGLAESAAAGAQAQLARVRSDADERVVAAHRAAQEARAESAELERRLDELRALLISAERDRDSAKSEATTALLARDKARVAAHGASAEVVRMMEALRVARSELEAARGEAQRSALTLAAEQQARPRACVMCLSAAPSRIFLPCSHFGVCEACADGFTRNARAMAQGPHPAGALLVKCPICMRASRLQQVFFS